MSIAQHPSRQDASVQTLPHRETGRSRRRVRRRLNRLAATWILVLASLASHPLGAQNLIDHNGKVMIFPDLYVTYWGSDWQNGFMTYGIPSTQFQSYTEGFLNSICNSDWLRTQMQYRFAGCPSNRVMGTWVDPIDPPRITPTAKDIHAEVKRSIEHFQGAYPGDPNAITIIMLAPGYGDTAFAAKGGGACAWHSMVGYRAFMVQPFTNDAPVGCRQFAVNRSPGDGFGHGVFDGDSIDLAHELAETLTDPDLSGGWYGQEGLNAETGDKCGSTYSNFAVNGTYYAVQALWSNSDGGCVFGGSAAFTQSPASHDFSNVIQYVRTDPVTVTVTNTGNLGGRVRWNLYLTGPDRYDFEISGNSCISGTPLRPGGTCTFDVTFRPTALGLRQAEVQLSFRGDEGRFTDRSMSLRGTGQPQWAAFDPESVGSFGSGTFIGSTAPPPELPVVLHNPAPDPRFIWWVQLGGSHPADFSILQDGCSDRILPPGGLCSVVLGFTPTATGERLAALEVVDGSGSMIGIPVAGTGLGPIAELSSDELSFGDAIYDSAGIIPGAGIPVSGEVIQQVELTNTGQAPLEVAGAEVSGDFVLEGNGCLAPLLPGQSCAIGVRLQPTHFQAQSGILRIHDNSSSSPHEVRLAAAVIAPVPSLGEDELQFGFAPVGTALPAQRVRLENLEGYVALHLESISATGGFTATSDCPADLTIGGCTISVQMSSAAAGPQNGMLVIADNAPGSPRQIPLGGMVCGAGTVDCDADELEDAADNCPFFPNTDQSNADGNGRGDACECGDQSGDHRVDVRDIVAINVAIFDPARASALCDGNNDGLCNVSDMVAVNREVFSAGSTSTCARQPVPGP